MYLTFAYGTAIIKLQGFVPVGEVDARGRARRLPIKADIRKALCFPGGSTLMVSHLSKDFSANSAESSDLSFPLKLLKKSLTPDVATNQYLEGLAENRSPPNRMNWVISGCQMKQPEEMLNGNYHISVSLFPCLVFLSACTFILFD